MTHQPVKVGDRARDLVSGFEGIVVARTEWLNRCVRLAIQPEPEKLHDGKPVDMHTFDEEQVMLVAADAHQSKKTAPTGGPTPDAMQHSDAVR